MRRLLFSVVIIPAALGLCGCVMWAHEYAYMVNSHSDSYYLTLQKVDHRLHCSAHALACTNWVMQVNLWLPGAPRGRQVFDATEIRLSSSDQSEPYRKYLLPFQSGHVIVDITTKVLILDAKCGDEASLLNGKYPLHLEGYVPPVERGAITARSSGS